MCFGVFEDVSGSAVDSHDWSFKIRVTEYVSDYGIKWMGGGTKWQWDRALR